MATHTKTKITTDDNINYEICYFFDGNICFYSSVMDIEDQSALDKIFIKYEGKLTSLEDIAEQEKINAVE